MIFIVFGFNEICLLLRIVFMMFGLLVFISVWVIMLFKWSMVVIVWWCFLLVWWVIFSIIWLGMFFCFWRIGWVIEILFINSLWSMWLGVLFNFVIWCVICCFVDMLRVGRSLFNVLLIKVWFCGNRFVFGKSSSFDKWIVRFVVDWFVWFCLICLVNVRMCVL